MVRQAPFNPRCAVLPASSVVTTEFQFWHAEQIADDPWKVLVAVMLLNKTTGKAAIPLFWKLIGRWGTPEELSQASVEELVVVLKPLGLYNVRAQRLKLLSQMYIDDPPLPDTPRTPAPARSRGRTPASPLLPEIAQVESPLKCTSSARRRPRTKAPLTPETPSSMPSRPRYPMTPISHLPGTGPYALDSYRIFCTTPSSGEWRAVMPADKELIRYLALFQRWKWAYEEGQRWVPDWGVIQEASEQYIHALIEELKPRSHTPAEVA
ncbi:DNA glycosylase [Leucogyrophana mollusca]|uniref:DNA glycosylase n=1 Tax=Leucogyrophana mollusca TaxID=85980 RepID=A0ACB8B9P7_9AGAM|nr:DNA glycosylase [Leucogyrophana mollusca]